MVAVTIKSVLRAIIFRVITVNAPQQKTLAQAAAEIQELLEQLDTEYDRTDYPQPIVDHKVQPKVDGGSVFIGENTVHHKNHDF